MDLISNTSEQKFSSLESYFILMLEAYAIPRIPEEMIRDGVSSRSGILSGPVYKYDQSLYACFPRGSCVRPLRTCAHPFRICVPSLFCCRDALRVTSGERLGEDVINFC